MSDEQILRDHLIQLAYSKPELRPDLLPLLGLPRLASAIKTPGKENFWGIMGRQKGEGKYKPFDYQSGKFVTNIMLQTMWPDKKHVQTLVDSMNQQNPDYEFKVVKRS